MKFFRKCWWFPNSKFVEKHLFSRETKSSKLQIENDGQMESINIINESNPKNDKAMKQSTKFNFQKNTVSGFVGKIEFMVIEFFRRRGVRFYES